jgi:hypothetical protein
MQVIFVSIAIFRLAIGVGRAQDIHNWTSKSGHVAKAVFESLDEAEGKVVLLVRKEIALDSLTVSSQELARSLATEKESTDIVDAA